MSKVSQRKGTSGAYLYKFIISFYIYMVHKWGSGFFIFNLLCGHHTTKFFLFKPGLSLTYLPIFVKWLND